MAIIIIIIIIIIINNNTDVLLKNYSLIFKIHFELSLLIWQF